MENNTDMYIYILVGGVNHLEKYESQWEGLYILWKIKNVPNHQPAYIYNGRIYTNKMNHHIHSGMIEYI
jgi:hypothetical protein